MGRGQTQIILKKIIGETDGVRQLTGSRYLDGHVPNVNWNDDKLNVNWYNPDNTNDNLRSRQKFPKEVRYRGFSFRYLIQPLVIFDISCRSDSILIYCFSAIILSSKLILINLFNISVLILAEFKNGNFLLLISKAVSIIRPMISIQIFSIFK